MSKGKTIALGVVMVVALLIAGYLDRPSQDDTRGQVLGGNR